MRIRPVARKERNMHVTGHLRVKRGILQMVFSYYDAEGKRHQSSESTGLPEKGNKREAQKMLDKRLEEMNREYAPVIESKSILFLTFMENWLDDVAAQNTKRNTLSEYRRVFEHYIKLYKPFHGVKLQDMTPALLQSYFNAQLKAGLSPNTVHKHKTNINKCLVHALRLKLIQSNPTGQVELPAKRKYTGAKACTPKQLRQLLEAFEGDVLETPVRITATYGLRRSEVCGLRWDAVSFEAGYISICHTALTDGGKLYFSDTTKNATSNRRLPLTDSMRAYLQSVKEQQEEYKRLFGESYTDSGFVCTKPDGTPLHPNFVTHHFSRALDAHGLPHIRFHDLRHSVVYALSHNNADVQKIKTWLGHSSITTTFNVYGHVLREDLDALGKTMDTVLRDGSKAG